MGRRGVGRVRNRTPAGGIGEGPKGAGGMTKTMTRARVGFVFVRDAERARRAPPRGAGGGVAPRTGGGGEGSGARARRGRVVRAGARTETSECVRRGRARRWRGRTGDCADRSSSHSSVLTVRAAHSSEQSVAMLHRHSRRVRMGRGLDFDRRSGVRRPVAPGQAALESDQRPDRRNPGRARRGVD